MPRRRTLRRQGLSRFIEPTELTLTEAMRKRLVDLVKNGVPWRFAASSVLLKRGTVEKWFQEGQEIEEHYEKHGRLPDKLTDHKRQCRYLYIDAMVASDVVVAGLCMRIQKASKSDWHAARWLLEVREPKTFKPSGTGLESDKPNSASVPRVQFVSPSNGRGKRPEVKP
jgi:hypothetical protein